MRRIVVILLVGLGLQWSCARSDDSAEVILDKAIKAAGGEARLATFKALTWKETVTNYVQEKQERYSSTGASQYPDRLRIVNSDSTVVINGDKGWAKNGSSAAQEFSKEDMEQIYRENLYPDNVARLLVLKEKGYGLKTLSETKIDGKPVAGLRVSHADRQDVLLYFAKDTWLLAKLEYTIKSAGKNVKTERLYSDYKELNGLAIATKQALKHDGKVVVEGQRSDLKVLEKLDPDLFSKP